VHWGQSEALLHKAAFFPELYSSATILRYVLGKIVSSSESSRQENLFMRQGRKVRKRARHQDVDGTASFSQRSLTIEGICL
jgi:hypothetical protein